MSTEVMDNPPPDEADSLQPGDHVGPYTIIRWLGQGGMGTVYLATIGPRTGDQEPARRVALKRVRAGRVTPGARRRFHAERAMLAQLEHSGIVRLLDGGTDADGDPYLVMEFIDGTSLDAYCDMARLSPRDCAAMVLDVADAVAHAHEQGIVHRDLKPTNVLVTRDGIPKVTDFGLARTLDRGEQTALTAPGTMIGTPAYMAPEQIGDGRGRNLPTVDCYGLGAILYRLLTGIPPFRADTDLETCLKILKEEPTPIRSLRPDVPRDLETIVLKAMARNSGDRFATAYALAEELRRFLDGRPLTIRRTSPMNKLCAWAGRHRAAVVAWSSAGAILTSALIAILIVSNARIRVERNRAEASLATLYDLVKKTTLAVEDLSEAMPLGSDRTHAYLIKMLDFYEQALTRIPGAEDDDDLHYRAALANYHMAISYESRGAVPNQPEVLRHLDRSIELLEALVRDHPENRIHAWFRYNLFRGLSTRATSLLHAGTARNQQRAVDDARRALAVIEALARETPGDPSEADCWDAVATQHARLSAILQTAAADAADPRLFPEEAERHARQTVEIAERLIARHPDRVMYVANIYRGSLRLGSIAGTRGDTVEAERSYRKALEANEELMQRGTDSIHYPFERAICLRELAVLLLDLDRSEEATGLIAEALSIGQKHAERYPYNGPYTEFFAGLKSLQSGDDSAR